MTIQNDKLQLPSIANWIPLRGEQRSKMATSKRLSSLFLDLFSSLVCRDIVDDQTQWRLGYGIEDRTDSVESSPENVDPSLCGWDPQLGRLHVLSVVCLYLWKKLPSICMEYTGPRLEPGFCGTNPRKQTLEACQILHRAVDGARSSVVIDPLWNRANRSSVRHSEGAMKAESRVEKSRC